MVKLKKKTLPTSMIVTQSNQLVTARYNLPLAEQRLILSMIARIQPDDEDFKPYRISIGELADFMGIDKNSAYRECKKITAMLLTRVVKIEEPGRLLQAGWVSSAEYIDGDGMVNLCFDPLLKPYLLQLKGSFTSCRLNMLLSFKSQYTVRIYSLLKQYQWRSNCEIEVEKLYDMLGIGKDQYKLYSDFRRYILNSTQKELTEKADLYFEYDEIKFGRRVGAVRFRILSKNSFESSSIDNPVDSIPTLLAPLINIEPSLLDKLLDLVPKIHQAKKTIQTALEVFEKKYGFDYVKRNILYSNAKADKSYAGFLNNALKADWGRDWNFDLELASKEKPVQKTLEVWELNGFVSQAEYDKYMWKVQMKKNGFEDHIPAGY
jgi:hypothetical protein